MRNIAEDTELNRRTSIPEVVIPDVVLQDGQQRSRSNSTYSADLETAITKTGCGKFNIALIPLTFIVSCINGFDTASMSYVIPVASVDLGLQPFERGLLQSSCYAGIIVAGLWWGFLSDAFGRKKVMVIAFLLDGLMNILIGAFPILPLMVLFKFLSGIMLSGSHPVYCTYIAEVFSIKRRDVIILSVGVFASVGQIMLSSLATVIIPTEVPSEIPFRSWQIFQMICSLPSLISGIGCLFFVESPKFLADKGNHEKALKVCQTIYSINTGKLSTTYPVKKLNHKSSTSEKKSNLSEFLKGLDILRPPFVQTVLVVSFLYLGSVACYNILHLWLPEMLTLIQSSELDPRQGICPLLQEGDLRRSSLTSSEDMHREKVFIQMIWANTGCLIGQLLFLVLINYAGKKRILFACAMMGGISSTLIPFTSADYIMLIGTVYMALYQICIFCCLNITIEIFPTRIRSTSVAVIIIFGKTGILVMNFLMVNLIYNYCEYLFFGISLLTVFMAGITFLIPKNPLEDKLLNSSNRN